MTNLGNTLRARPPRSFGLLATLCLFTASCSSGATPGGDAGGPDAGATRGSDAGEPDAAPVDSFAVEGAWSTWMRVASDRHHYVNKLIPSPTGPVLVGGEGNSLAMGNGFVARIAEDGRHSWYRRYDLQEFYFATTTPAGTVVVASGGSMLTALRDQGETRWSVDLSEPGFPLATSGLFTSSSGPGALVRREGAADRGVPRAGLVSFDEAGSLVWARLLQVQGVADADVGWSAVASRDGRLLLLGRTTERSPAVLLVVTLRPTGEVSAAHGWELAVGTRPLGYDAWIEPAADGGAWLPWSPGPDQWGLLRVDASGEVVGAWDLVYEGGLRHLGSNEVGGQLAVWLELNDGDAHSMQRLLVSPSSGLEDVLLVDQRALSSSPRDFLQHAFEVPGGVCAAGRQTPPDLETTRAQPWVTCAPDASLYTGCALTGAAAPTLNGTPFPVRLEVAVHTVPWDVQVSAREVSSELRQPEETGEGCPPALVYPP